MRLRDRVQELRELGAWGTAYRIGRELWVRSGVGARLHPRPSATPAGLDAWALRWLEGLPFAHPAAMSLAMSDRLDDAALDALVADADAAAEGRIRHFGGDRVDCGNPVVWHRDPISGARWPSDGHAWECLAAGPGAGCGDVKLTWEAARFPQAYHLARAAALGGDDAQRARWAGAFAAQVSGFLDASPFPRGIHWGSSQEAVIRLCAWLFGLSVFHRLGYDQSALAQRVAAHAWTLGHQLADEIGYALHAVYNNHLVAEAFGLELCARLVPPCDTAADWRSLGGGILTAQAGRQVYPDGAYINQSHTYHRAALHDYLLAARFRQAVGEPVPAAWHSAMARSLAFLVAQQNPRDGRLPNYGSNDGSMPRVLSTCAYADFRPTLQSLAAAVYDARLYEPGPWDEEVAWLHGPGVLDRPRQPIARQSVSFAHTGYHVLRGSDPSSFLTFRCGTLRDRFTQLDMLHLDVWWRGHNVLADGGSYLYNGPARWHDHFLRTASHNTVTVDGADQMLHARRFKVLYPTEAALTRFAGEGPVMSVAGLHRGYRRLPEGVDHHRAVLTVDAALTVVVDAIVGTGTHTARLHWLAGDHPHRFDAATSQLTLDTPDGPFCVAVYTPEGHRCPGDVVRGDEAGPRGWLSRTYHHKVPVASLACVRAGPCAQLGTVTVLSGGDEASVRVEGARWRVQTASGTLEFELHRGDDGTLLPRVAHWTPTA